MAAPVRTLYDPEAAASRAELYESYRTMRDEQPVYEDPDGRFVALTRFVDVAEAATDAVTYSSEITANTTLVHPILAQLDPPRHTAMRRLILRAFTPSRVAEREAEIRAIAVDLLGRAIEHDSFDLIADFAALLPSIVMGRLIGIPDELIATCREISDLHMRRISQRDALVPMRMSDELFRPLLAARRSAPADDLLSGLVTAEVDGRRLTDEELLGFCYLLLIGGNDTTSNWIGNTAVVLAEHPGVRAELVDDPSLLPAALEEGLRLESPTQVLPRRTADDVTLHDTRVAAGTRVLLVWGAANRDEREFAGADHLDIRRPETRHLAFGQGIHFCLGAALARLEARVAFEELLSRVPTYELAAPPEPVRSSWALGYARVPIR
jgi:cytochrome P450 family 130